jgi:hypothetical protein
MHQPRSHTLSALAVHHQITFVADGVPDDTDSV